LLRENYTKTRIYTITRGINCKLFVYDWNISKILFSKQIGFTCKILLGYTDLGAGIFMIFGIKSILCKNEITYADLNNDFLMTFYKVKHKHYNNSNYLCMVNLLNKAIYVIPKSKEPFEKYDLSQNKWYYIPCIKTKNFVALGVGKINSNMIYCIGIDKCIYYLDANDEEFGWYEIPIYDKTFNISYTQYSLQCNDSEILVFGPSTDWVKYDLYKEKTKAEFHVNSYENFFSDTMFIRKNFIYSLINESFAAYCLYRKKIYYKRI